MEFKLVSDYQPTGDQPEAISQLIDGLESGINQQTLLGVTGSGKTFTIANVIKKVNKPTLILSHNKTLAAQLYGEFKQFFPKNKVTNDYILLSKLPPRKDENDDNIPSLKVKLIATKNIPAKHICFSSVSLATYHNSIDNEALEKNRKA